MWGLQVVTSTVLAFLFGSVQAFDNTSVNTGLVCGPMEFACKNAYRCLERSEMCNGRNDCWDNSDEDLTNCILHEVVTAQLNCTSDEFQCKNGFRCVPKKFLCDNDNDCKDYSDEDPMECIRAGLYDDHVTCADIGFTCKGGTGSCISRMLMCNGKNDCGDNSDENVTNCRAEGVVPDELKCKYNEFQCKNKRKCIHNTRMCDNDNDCYDGSDEDPVECAKEGVIPEGATCADLGFECTNTTFGGSFCIGNLLICDGKDDCGDNSDENPDICEHRADKPLLEILPWFEPPELNSTVLRRCGNAQFQCGYHEHECSSKKHLCDSKISCRGQVHMTACHKPTNAHARKCKSHEFKCKSNNGTECIHEFYVCDGDNDCSDMSDEDVSFCNSRTALGSSRTQSSTRTRPLICKRGQFKCSDGIQCIRNALVCDRNRECEDGSDETSEACLLVGIQPPNTTAAADTSCGNGHFKCNNERCIQSSYVCDGDNDCGDYTDESASHCNGSSNTRSGGHVISVVPASCTTGGKFLCHIATHALTCIPHLQVCDGTPNCPNGEDEHPELCHRPSATLEPASSTGDGTAVKNCAADEFPCADGKKCIRKTNLCDGSHECGDRSDEDPAICLLRSSSQSPLKSELEVSTEKPSTSGHHHVQGIIFATTTLFCILVVVIILFTKCRPNQRRY